MAAVHFNELLTTDNLEVRLDWAAENSNRMRLLWLLHP